MITAKGDGRAHDIVECTIARNDLIFDLNNPDIDDLQESLNDCGLRKTVLERTSQFEAVSIHNDCREAAHLLAALL